MRNPLFGYLKWMLFVLLLGMGFTASAGAQTRTVAGDGYQGSSGDEGLSASTPPMAGCAPMAVSRVSGTVDESMRVPLSGNVHPLARAEFDRGKVSDSLLLEHIVMLLKRSSEQEVALQTRIDQMHSHNSKLFHQWLGASQVGNCYGVADADIAAVTSWLQKHGFKIDSIPAGKTMILFTGTAGQVQEAFGTRSTI